MPLRKVGTAPQNIEEAHDRNIQNFNRIPTISLGKIIIACLLGVFVIAMIDKFEKREEV